MRAELHYDGRAYRLSGGEEGAEKLLLDIRNSARGGIVEVETREGNLAVVVGPGIPAAVLTVDE